MSSTRTPPTPGPEQTLDAALRAHAHEAPNTIALIADGRRYSYADLDHAADRVAARLRQWGLHPGDRFALLAPNSAEFVIALYGALRARAIVVPLNPAGAPAELDDLLADSGVSILAFEEPAAKTGAGDAPGAKAQDHAQTHAGTEHADAALAAGWHPLTRLAAVPAIVTPLRELVHGTSDEPTKKRAAPETAAAERAAVVMPASRTTSEPAPTPAPQPGDDALILYTSGTTGRPKGALFDQQRSTAAAQSVAEVSGLTADDTLLIAAPLHHAAALGVLLFPAALAGATAVLLPRFDAADALAAIERERISVLFGVPTMYQLLLRETGLGIRDLTSWRLALFGGASMPIATVDALHAALPGTGLLQLCGQTEGGPGGIYSTPAQVAAAPGASGHQAMPGSEIRLVTRDGQVVTPGPTLVEPVIGELHLRAPSVMKGYWRDPEATAAAFADGWLRTGDVVRVDLDGSLTVVDRLKDVIITGGRNVYSAEVESVIAELPGVAACAVIGTADPLYGETVTAVIEARDGVTLGLTELGRHCRDRLAGYKVPRRLVLRRIPRSASGKADKVALRREIGDRV